jgi:hypothetical protein
MATGSIAQSFQASYSGTRRVNTGRNTEAQRQNVQPAKVTHVETSSPARRRRALAIWFEEQDLREVDNADYEAQRMVGDTATVLHLDYKPTAALTPRWEAFGTAYGVRFILSLWQEDIDFINTITGAGIGRSHYTPAKALEIVVKRIDPKRGMTGATAVFHKGCAIFTNEAAYYQTPPTRKFQPQATKPRQAWKESPFKSVGQK